ncbi:MAG: VCBS repeat-containing protein [Maribacter sp.]|nr:VCBS repeat-containing protein [Maribacter sp.]
MWSIDSIAKWLAAPLCFLLLTNLALAQVEKRFTLLNSSKTGIDFNNKIKDNKRRNILLYSNFYGGAGVGVGDFNNDGLQDIFFAGNIVDDKLFFNNGNLRFKDVTKASGIKNDGGWSTGVTVADVNNDGFLDIYVSRELYDNKPKWRTNLLYINKGDGTFEELAKAYGVDNSERTRHATFLDYDKDGFLDLLLLTQPPNPGSYSEFSGTTLLKPEYHLVLYRNTGKNSFIEVSESTGINKTGFPNAVSVSDLNNDGWEDIYVTNDFYAPDFIFLNNKNGTFTNVANEALNHMSYYSMGIDVADLNNDNYLDVFVLDMVAEDNFRLKSNMSGMNPDSFWKVVDDGGHYQYMYNALQLNNGNMTFSDIAQFTGMAATDWSWSNLIADFDNDGLKDTYITNGLLRDIRNTDADKRIGQYITETANKWVMENPDGGDISIWDILNLDQALSLVPSQPLKNYAYKNQGDLEFIQIAEEWGLDQESFSNGSAYADFDNDGDLDIVVNNINDKAFVYRNNSETFPKSNYLRIALLDESGKPVFGSRVKIFTKGKMQVSESTNVRGIYSTSESFVHFGLGDNTMVDSIQVQWPNSNNIVRYDIAANQTLKIINKRSAKPLIDKKTTVHDTYFEEVTGTFALKHTHKENDFDDFGKQILMPHKMSQFGPAMAIADVDNDGLDDVFIGAATGHEAVLYIQKGNGTFVKRAEELWKREDDYEDVDALFVDVNGDGYKDLYVVSGGNEYPLNDLHYVDRIYMNNGKGDFNKGAILGVGRMSGSKVIADDIDKDGDIDLFVGGRHAPHYYPLPATSMILINENGQLINKTDSIAPELINFGMLTDAVWDDYDSDGDVDLIVVGEWMAITVFDNKDGIFAKTTIPDLEHTRGWWFSLDKGDFDGDGDMDYIAGNLGLNYKYKTSEKEPFDIYYNDFDGNGNYDIVLGYYNQNKHYPLRGFSCSSQQIPGLKDKIKKYDLFASLEIDEVYGENNLKNSLHLVTDTFASTYVENLGNGKFKTRQLPNALQLSNVNDTSILDYNNDGHLDILAVSNLFVSEIETPRNDAGIGLLMLGDGTGGFTSVPGYESGFLARKDTKKLGLLKHKEGLVMVVANNDDTVQFFRLR